MASRPFLFVTDNVLSFSDTLLKEKGGELKCDADANLDRDGLFSWNMPCCF